MTKKNIFTIISIAAAVLAGCSDQYLQDMKDYSGFNEEVYKNESEASGLVDYIYNQIEPANNSTPIQTLGDGAGYTTTFSGTTDEFGGLTNYNNPNTILTYQTVSTYFATPMSSSLANNTYTRIKQMNLFLDNIDVYGSATISKASRDKFKGQIYFWRAWQYYDMVRLYGGVPLVLHAQVPSTTDSSLRVPRSSTTDCIKQICIDLDSAINLLPATMTGSDYGRVDKAAAAAFKARVLTTIASPLFNTDWQNISSAKWQAAYDAHVAAKPYLDAAGKLLFGESAPGTRAKAWSDVFKQSLNGASKKVNPEAIIVYLYSSAISSGSSAYRANGWENAIRTTLSGGGASIKPTAQMIDKFPMIDGTRPIKGTGGNYDTLNFFVNRDPRFYRTFAFNGSFWPYKDSLNNATVWSYYWPTTATSTTYNNAEAGSTNAGGAFVRKMSQDGNIAKADFLYSVSDIIEFRYAEFLLNWAECAAGLNKLDEAFTILKRIRARASILPGADGTYGLGTAIQTDRYKMFEAILYERSIELAFEGKRFFDLRRWKLFGDATDNNAVCNLLGVAPLNGSRRTGFYVLVDPAKPAVIASPKKGIGASGPKNDPLLITGLRPKFDGATITAAIGRVDPDASDANWNAGISTLKTFYTNYFKRVNRDDLDQTSPRSVFSFRPEYYIFGLSQAVLQASDYLNSQQTTGWQNNYGQPGTFDPVK